MVARGRNIYSLVLEKVGYASSNITKTSHAPTCNALNIWQLAICIDHALLFLIKDAIGKELSKP